MSDERRDDEEQRPPHVPDPTAMSGNLDTSGTTGGGGDSELRNLAPIFDVAEAQDLTYAGRAMDPNDHEVPADHVQTSPGFTVVQGDPEADKARVRQRGEEARERLRANAMERHLERQGPVSDRRREEDERAWAASVSSLGPAIVITERELGYAPPPPASVIDNRPEDERSPEGVPSADGTVEHESVRPGESGYPPEGDPLREQLEDVSPGAQEPTEPDAAPKPDPASTEPSEPASEPPAPQGEGSEPAPESKVVVPNKASSKQEWVEWAVACGADRNWANEQTRLKLISEYAKLRPNER